MTKGEQGIKKNGNMAEERWLRRWQEIREKERRCKESVPTEGKD